MALDSRWCGNDVEWRRVALDSRWCGNDVEWRRVVLDSRFPCVHEDGNDVVVRRVVSVQTYPSPSKNCRNSRAAIVIAVIPANAGIQVCLTRRAGFPLVRE